MGKEGNDKVAVGEGEVVFQVGGLHKQCFSPALILTIGWVILLTVGSILLDKGGEPPWSPGPQRLSKCRCSCCSWGRL